MTLITLIALLIGPLDLPIIPDRRSLLLLAWGLFSSPLHPPSPSPPAEPGHFPSLVAL